MLAAEGPALGADRGQAQGPDARQIRIAKSGDEPPPEEPLVPVGSGVTRGLRVSPPMEWKGVGVEAA